MCVQGPYPPPPGELTPRYIDSAAAGVGEDHAKWSPVATTWYKLMPEVVLLQPVLDDMAEELAGEGAGEHAVGLLGPSQCLGLV
jgi:hypothetical protein